MLIQRCHRAPWGKRPPCFFGASGGGVEGISGIARSISGAWAGMSTMKNRSSTRMPESRGAMPRLMRSRCPFRRHRRRAGVEASRSVEIPRRYPTITPQIHHDVAILVPVPTTQSSSDSETGPNRYRASRSHVISDCVERALRLGCSGVSIAICQARLPEPSRRSECREAGA